MMGLGNAHEIEVMAEGTSKSEGLVEGHFGEFTRQLFF